MPIPLYSIDRFSKNKIKRVYEIEVFDKNRNFNVRYPHRHDFYEILFITHGTGEHNIDFNKYSIQPNTIFFLSPGQIHSLSLSDDIKGFIFLFTSEFYLLNKLNENKLLEFPFFYNLSDETPPLILNHQKEIDFLYNLFLQATNENSQDQLESEEMIRSLLDIILIICLRLYSKNNPDKKLNKGKLIVKKFKLAIEEKYKENPSVKHYADLLAITPNHLNETVKKFTGLTATEVLNNKIILEIKRLLVYSELTISQIAGELNFSDQSYFSKYFKNITGTTPGNFRKNPL